MPNKLTAVEQRGWLTLRRDGHPLITRTTIPGWFRLSPDGKNVLVRQVGSSQSYSIASILAVIEFRADKTAK